MSLQKLISEASAVEPGNSWDFDLAMRRYTSARNYRDALMRDLQIVKDSLREAQLSGGDTYMWEDLAASCEASLLDENRLLDSLRSQISNCLGMQYIPKQLS